MKKLSFLLIVAVAMNLQVFAQASKVTSGVLSLQQGKTAEAVEALQTALDNRHLIKEKKREKLLAKAHFNMHKALVQVATDTSLKEVAQRYPRALFLAKSYLDSALNSADGKKYETTSTLENSNGVIWGALYNNGVTMFNQGGKDKEALEHFVVADQCYPEHFLTNRMLGSAYLMAKDTANAVSKLEHTLDIYQKRYVDVEDEEALKVLKDGLEYKQDHSQLSYIFQQLAVIFNAQGNPAKALETLEKGEKMVPEDKDIKRQQLAVFQQNPDLFEQAEAKFTNALKQNPDDNAIRLAFAGLLDKVGQNDRAFEYYEEAYKLDPESLQANYGIGAYYINKAAEESGKKMELNKDAEIEAADQRIKDMCEKAYPYMIWLNKKQPNEREWLSQLVNITAILGKTEEMEVFGKKLGELSRAAEGN